MRRIELHFPILHEVPRVDDQRNGLRWRDARKEVGPHKTIYNRFIRWLEPEGDHDRRDIPEGAPDGG